MNTSWWRVLAAGTALVLIMAAWTYAVAGNPDAALAWALGSVLFVIGVGLLTTSTARVLRENAGHRVPFWGAPPVRPRRLDLLAGLGGPLAAGGAIFIAMALDRGLWPVLPLMAVVALLVILLQLAHNRRLPAA